MIPYHSIPRDCLASPRKPRPSPRRRFLHSAPMCLDPSRARYRFLRVGRHWGKPPSRRRAHRPGPSSPLCLPGPVDGAVHGLQLDRSRRLTLASTPGGSRVRNIGPCRPSEIYPSPSNPMYLKIFPPLVADQLILRGQNILDQFNQRRSAVPVLNYSDLADKSLGVFRLASFNWNPGKGKRLRLSNCRTRSQDLQHKWGDQRAQDVT